MKLASSALPDDLQPLRPMGAGWMPGRGADDSAAEEAGEAPLAAPTPSGAALDSAGSAAASRCTTVFINLATIMERVDEQLLPALYRFVGASFHATPQQLGVLTFSRAVVQALASPLAGLLGHYFNRVHIICAGAALWGTCCLAFATTDSISQAIPFWAANGVGLALLIPAAQSLTADLNPSAHRGRAFGLLHLTGAVGALLGTLFGTNIGHTHPAGIQGWRVAFAAVALCSWIIGLCTLLFARDPRPPKHSSGTGPRHLPDFWADLAQLGGAVLCIPSVLIIVLQGIVGTTPWVALVFLTLYLQLLGFSDLAASLLLAVFLAANAAGGLLGGLLGDWAAQRWPDHGRIAVCQASVAAGIPLSALLFKGLPTHASIAAGCLYAAVLSVTGLTITWAGTACNNPIFAEIVQPAQRNLIYAFDRSFEGAVAACAAPLVGWLAEKAFSFRGTAEVGADAQENRDRAAALGSALLVIAALPWTLCLVFFTGLHFTYPRDRVCAAAAASAASASAAVAGEAYEDGVELVAVGSGSVLSEEGITEEDKRVLLG